MSHALPLFRRISRVCRPLPLVLAAGCGSLLGYEDGYDIAAGGSGGGAAAAAGAGAGGRLVGGEGGSSASGMGGTSAGAGSGGANAGAGAGGAGAGGANAGAAGANAGAAGANAGAAGIGGAGLGGSGGGNGGAAGGVVAPTVSPWGIANSTSSSFTLENWLGPVKDAGITWLRGVDNGSIDDRLATAKANGIQVAGILLYSKAKPVSFPVDDPTGWNSYVTGLLTKTKGKVAHWEIWNEPPNFTEDKSPASYATIVKQAYDAAKAIDPSVQIGLSAASNHVLFLDQSIVAGAKGHFDYVTVHPYEILDLVEDGWEPMYLSVVPTLRRMLAARDPARAKAEIWFTEVGTPVQNGVTPQVQARQLVKAYVLGIAQGAAHIHWFEGKDGDSGPFGLIDAAGNKRISYTALTSLTQALGPFPAYLGWVLLQDRHYGFVFQGPKGPVMVAWAQPGETAAVSFDAPVAIVEPTTGVLTSQTTLALTRDPSIVSGLPAALVAQANAHRGSPLPWGGDYAGASSISYSPGKPAGLHPVGKETLQVVDGTTVRDVSPGGSIAFTVDPTFLAYDNVPITITAEVRRNGDATAGFNLKYESTTGTKSTGAYYTVPAGNVWVSKTWTIPDAQLVGKWGYHFVFDSDSTMFSGYNIRKVTVSK